jgi:hypothetical protein
VRRRLRKKEVNSMKNEKTKKVGEVDEETKEKKVILES